LFETRHLVSYSNHFTPGDCTEFFHAATADLISAPTLHLGFTNRGVNHGNIPIKSGVTKI